MSLIAALCVAALLAQSPERGPELGVGAGTDFPLSVGAHLRAELPGRLQLGVAAGLLPRPYLDTINEVLVSMGAYDQNTAELIAAALHNALVLRGQLGWRPFASSGFYFSGGYTLVTLGGSLTGSEIVSAATGVSPPGSERVEVQATSSLHQAGVELGWRWPLGQRFRLEAAIGGFVTLAASTQMDSPDSPVFSRLATPLFAAGENYLNDRYTSYVHAGYVGLRGYFSVF